ncbi:MAG: hypothetical protein LBL07_12200 [Tannerella sp.]|jgi:thioredoxin-like negative regulator of GroEL|nr:hypothetical protein [Tannerella sp.]
MRNDLKTAGKLKASHVMIAFLSFTVFVYVAHYSTGKKKQLSTTDHCLIELQPESVSEILSASPCVVLFYDENTDICEKMGYHLNPSAKRKKNSYVFSRLNPEKHPEYIATFDVPDAPGILIFKKNKKIKRILGNVPGKNPESIYNSTDQ